VKPYSKVSVEGFKQESGETDSVVLGDSSEGVVGGVELISSLLLRGCNLKTYS
jgi:hypothetical protein